MPNKFLKIQDVVAITALSRSYVYALAKEGRFPKRVKIAERSSAWIDSEIQEWIQNRIAERDQEAA